MSTERVFNNTCVLSLLQGYYNIPPRFARDLIEEVCLHGLFRKICERSRLFSGELGGVYGMTLRLPYPTPNRRQKRCSG
jgi:hypothetical protein